MKISCLLTVFLLSTFSSVSARAGCRAVAVTPLVNGEDFATRIEKETGLHGTPSEVLAVFQRARPDLGISSLENLSAYLRTLSNCTPSGRYKLGRLCPNGPGTWVRQVVPKEGALCDPNRDNEVVVIRQCGNPGLAAQEAQREMAPTPLAAVHEAQVGNRPNLILWQRGHRMSPEEISRAFEDVPDQSQSGQIWRTVRTGVSATGEAAAGFGVGWGIRGMKAAANTLNQTFNGAPAGSASAPLTRGGPPIDPGTDLFGVDPGPRP